MENQKSGHSVLPFHSSVLTGFACALSIVSTMRWLTAIIAPSFKAKRRVLRGTKRFGNWNKTEVRIWNNVLRNMKYHFLKFKFKKSLKHKWNQIELSLVIIMQKSLSKIYSSTSIKVHSNGLTYFSLALEKIRDFREF